MGVVGDLQIRAEVGLGDFVIDVVVGDVVVVVGGGSMNTTSSPE